MPYLIDGHNLIGRMPDIHLSDPDDEEKLVSRLEAFCRAAGKKVEVIFDNAAPGQAQASRRGALTIRFTAYGATADDAIRRRLQQLKGAAKTWTVVSSDRQVQAEARSAGAAVVPSENFAARLDPRQSPQEEDGEIMLGEEEVQEWLELFEENEESDQAG